MDQRRREFYRCHEAGGNWLKKLVNRYLIYTYCSGNEGAKNELN